MLYCKGKYTVMYRSFQAWQNRSDIEFNEQEACSSPFNVFENIPLFNKVFQSNRLFQTINQVISRYLRFFLFFHGRNRRIKEINTESKKQDPYKSLEIGSISTRGTFCTGGGGRKVISGVLPKTKICNTMFSYYLRMF